MYLYQQLQDTEYFYSVSYEPHADISRIVYWKALAVELHNAMSCYSDIVLDAVMNQIL